MAILLRALCLLPLLFGLARPQLFPFLNPFLKPVPTGGDESQGNGETTEEVTTNYEGLWEIIVENQGVSGMHTALMHNNKVIIYDATNLGPSQLKLAGADLDEQTYCRPMAPGEKPNPPTAIIDCWAHSIEYDLSTGNIRPLKLLSNAWCSSGGLDADGKLVSTGGWADGGRIVRSYTACNNGNCDWDDTTSFEALSGQRWYATQAILPDGSFIVIGGRRMFNYEFVPKDGEANGNNYKLPLLDQTNEIEENNLYPFVYLSTDGNLFVLANNRAILLDYQNHKVVREFPELPDGSRSYPPSAMSALIPIRLHGQNKENIPAEVIVCGGSTRRSFSLASREPRKGGPEFVPATKSCGRITITDPKSQWKMETMPTARVMGDMLILPTGDLLLLNGAQKGCSGWTFARDPNFIPTLYGPKKPRGQRFTELKPTQIARMYHASSALLPDGKILVTGSNTNDRYAFEGVDFPTELRMETFSPPYLDPALESKRPQLLETISDTKLEYNQEFNVKFRSNIDDVAKNDIDVRMYRPPFTTHGFSMDQRQLILAVVDFASIGPGSYNINLLSPPSNVIAPPGYYLIFVNYKGVPSPGMWIHIK